MIRTCNACQKRNRIPTRHLVHAGKCGSCGAALAPLAQPLEVDEQTFEQVRTEVEVPVLVDFWAPWCGPCRAAAPALQKLAAEKAGQALIVKVNTDEHPALAARFGARGIPHFVVLKGGEVASQHTGLAPADEMRSWLS